jgi:hypothetical protein
MTIENGVQCHEDRQIQVSNESSSFISKRKFKFYYLKRKPCQVLAIIVLQCGDAAHVCSQAHEPVHYNCDFQPSRA